MFITHIRLKITAQQLETAVLRFLVKCADAQSRSLEGTLMVHNDKMEAQTNVYAKYDNENICPDYNQYERLIWKRA